MNVLVQTRQKKRGISTAYEHVVKTEEAEAAGERESKRMEM